jgi:NifB/MoaA-like Fe-S oxidoreductase
MRRANVVTGTLAVPVLADAVARLNRVGGLRVDLIPVTNTFFGGSVTCAGLLTGADLLRTLDQERARLGDVVLIPSVAFKDEDDIFLDDVTLADVEAGIDRRVLRVEATARGLARTLCDAVPE